MRIVNPRNPPKRNHKRPRRPKARTRAQQNYDPRPSVRAVRKAERQAQFLGELRKLGSVIHAAEAAGIGASTAYQWRREDPDGFFGAKWDEAIELSTERLESALYERALGVKRAIYQNGKLVGYERTHSDRAAMFLLAGRKPEVYGNRAVRTRTASTIAVTTRIDLLPNSDLCLLHRILAKVSPCESGQISEAIEPEAWIDRERLHGEDRDLFDMLLAKSRGCGSEPLALPAPVNGADGDSE